MSEKKIKLSFVLPAGPDDVFIALTKPGIIKRWSGQSGMVELSVGGKMEMFDGWVKGVILECKPSRQLSYSWKTSEWPADTPETIVKYELTRLDGGTRVDLEHWGFPNDQEAREHEEGWHEYFFKPLQEYLAKQKPVARQRTTKRKTRRSKPRKTKKSSSKKKKVTGSKKKK
jgi:uncharacterized protein YndB with AHSA1/START domain